MFALLISCLITGFSWAQQLPMPSGFYSSGKLDFAWQLPQEGEGFVRLSHDRDHGWGTQSMIEMIERTSIEMSQLYPTQERLLVGAISKEKGGRIRRHNSHQNGLDVDLGYFRVNGQTSPGNPNRFLETMVRRGRLSKNFDLHRNWELVKTLFRYGKVQRIFMDRVIKRELCKYSKEIGEKEAYQEVLRSIQHYPNHRNHFHVRLHCPDFADKCRKQFEPHQDLGC